MINYKYPRSFPKSEEIKMYVNGEEVDVLRTNVAYFATVSYNGNANVVIETCVKVGKVKVSPMRLNVETEVNGQTVILKVKTNLYLHIEIEGVKFPLFFYGNHEKCYDEKATYYFKRGQIYEIGELVLRDNESVYIEDGAVVKGAITARDASNIKIYGQGVVDGSYFEDQRGSRRTIVIENCTDVEIEDIIMVEPPCWMILIAGCRNVHINRVKQIGEVISSDGIDLVGSSNVLIENCILRNNDDCVVIKGFEHIDIEKGDIFRGNKNVEDIMVRGCILVNAQAGNAIEIGHELTIDEVRNVKFVDIDIVSVHGHGAAFSIHAGDHAMVRDIVFENIRVEHYYDKLVDFRIMRSRFNKDEERGQMRNILLKDIFVNVSPYNPGYSISVIGGYDSEHTVEEVTFENFYLNDTKVLNATQLDLFTKDVKKVVFK